MGFIGLLLLAAIVALLFTGKWSPAVIFVFLPVIVALFIPMPEVVGLSNRFIEIGKWINSGIGTTTGTATLFIFSIPFFFIMNEIGVFNPLINAIVRFADGNPVRVTVFTVLLTIVAHLDGSGASTALICIPALLPIYKKMNMRPHLLVFIVAMAAGIMNITPWGGPTIRASGVIGVDANVIWHKMIPIQILGLIISLALAVFFGMREKRHQAEAEKWYKDNPIPTEAKNEVGSTNLSTGMLWFNIILILAIIAILVWGEINSSVVFMAGTAIALFANYRGQKDQEAVLGRAAKGVLAVVAILLASGAMIGILENSGMLAAMGEMILGILPPSLGRAYNLIVGFLAAPIAVVFGTDSYFFGLLPIIAAVGQGLGLSPQTAANILIIGHNFTVFVSPFTPAMFLMIGLAGVPLKDHLKFSLPWAIAASWVSVIVAFVLGII